jgi:hypothetical protein
VPFSRRFAPALGLFGLLDWDYSGSDYSGSGFSVNLLLDSGSPRGSLRKHRNSEWSRCDSCLESCSGLFPAPLHWDFSHSDLFPARSHLHSLN